MALAAVSQDASVGMRKGIIDCNVESFRAALHRAFEPPGARAGMEVAAGAAVGGGGVARGGIPFHGGGAGSAAGFSDRDSALTGGREGRDGRGDYARGASRGGSMAYSPADALGALPVASVPRDGPMRGMDGGFGIGGRSGDGRMDGTGIGGSFDPSPASYQHVGSLRKVVVFGPTGGDGGGQSYISGGSGGVAGSIQ